MKVFLLAAGYGTRLKPITDTIPKCLVEICGKPLLGWWLDLFKNTAKENDEIYEIFINTHYLSEQVNAYIKEWMASNPSSNLIVTTLYEKELLGSCGTIRKWIDSGLAEGTDKFLICYADNLTNVNLNNLINNSQGILTMGLFHAENPKGSGIVELNDNNLIVDFQEKPEFPKSDLANAGIYVMSKDIVPYLNGKDIGYDVLPQLINKSYGYIIEEYLRDIGTLESYKKANEE